MSVFDRIKKLSKGRDKSLQDIAEEIGFSKNIFYKWKTSDPKAVDLQKVADYFGVSVDYLLGRTENPTMDDSAPDEVSTFFRINTEGLSDDEKEEFQEEMLEFMEFVKHKFEEKRRKKN